MMPKKNSLKKTSVQTLSVTPKGIKLRTETKTEAKSNLFLKKRNYFILGGIILFFVGILFFSTLFNNTQYKQILPQAETAFKNKEYTEAVILYQKAIAFKNDESLPYLKIASIYELKNNSAEVIKIIQQGLKSASAKDDLYKKLGETYLQTKEYKLAKESFAELSTTSTQRELFLLEVALKQNDLTAAQSEIDHLTEISSQTNSNLEQFYYFKGLYLIATNLEKAKSELEKETAVSLQEQKVKLIELLNSEKSDFQTLLLGQELTKQGFSALALPSLQTVVTTQSQSRDAYLVLGSAYYENNQSNEALQNWQKAADLDPSYGETFYLLGQAYYSQKDFPNAQIQIEKAVTLEKSNPLLYRLLARIYAQQNLCDRTITTQEKLVNEISLWQSKEERLDNQITLVKDYQNCQLIDLALSLSEKLSKLDPSMDTVSANRSTEIMELYLWSKWLKNQDINTSLTDYQNFTSKNPDFALGHYHYGLLLEKSGEQKQGQQEKNRGFELDLSGEIKND